MDLYKNYYNYLKNNTKLKEGTIKNYISSLKTVINYFQLDESKKITYNMLYDIFTNNNYI